MLSVSILGPVSPLGRRLAANSRREGLRGGSWRDPGESVRQQGCWQRQAETRSRHKQLIKRGSKEGSSPTLSLAVDEDHSLRAAYHRALRRQHAHCTAAGRGTVRDGWRLAVGGWEAQQRQQNSRGSSCSAHRAPRPRWPRGRPAPPRPSRRRATCAQGCSRGRAWQHGGAAASAVQVRPAQHMKASRDAGGAGSRGGQDVGEQDHLVVGQARGHLEAVEVGCVQEGRQKDGGSRRVHMGHLPRSRWPAQAQPRAPKGTRANSACRPSQPPVI